MSLSKCSFDIIPVPNGLVNKKVEGPKRRVPWTPPHLPRAHLVCGFFGEMRSGKTNGLVNMLQEYYDYGTFNLLYAITPSYESNTILHTLPFESDGIFTDTSHAQDSLMTILDVNIANKAKEYEFEEKYKVAFTKWLNSGPITHNEGLMLEREHYREPQKVEWPRPAIFIDDMINTELMANTIRNKLSNLAFHHRHIEGGIGVSIFLALQTFKNGLPRGIRTCLTCACLFSNCSKSVVEDMHEEVASNISLDTFKEVFFKATEEPHGFLMVDKSAEPGYQFGLSFDRKFYIDPIAERRKVLFGDEEKRSKRKSGSIERNSDVNTAKRARPALEGEDDGSAKKKPKKMGVPSGRCVPPKAGYIEE